MPRHTFDAILLILAVFVVAILTATPAKPEERVTCEPGGEEARKFLSDYIPDGWFQINSMKDGRGKYGRPLVILYPQNFNINAALVEDGHAAFKEY